MAPVFSVVVPVYRQWERVPDLLAGLRAQSLPATAVEVILVDNAATAEAPPALALPANARMLHAPAPGSYAARNAGAAAARGDWLAFTDADCRPEAGWLAAFARAADAAPSRLLAGPVGMIAPSRPNAFATYDLVRGIPQAAYVARGYAATANLAVPRGVFEALGGFDPGRFSGGDAAFCRRAGAAGHALAFVADARVGHPCRTSWAELATKARRTKGGQVAAGPRLRRAAWVLRTLCPPVRDSLAYLRTGHPLADRLTAVAVRLRVWGVELAETARLARRAPPERR